MRQGLDKGEIIAPEMRCGLNLAAHCGRSVPDSSASPGVY